MAIFIELSSYHNSIDFYNQLLQNITFYSNGEWEADKDGDITISQSGNLYHAAWFRIHKTGKDHQIILGMLCRNDNAVTNEIYALFHSKILMLLLLLFDSMIDSITISSMADPHYDIIQPNE